MDSGSQSPLNVDEIVACFRSKWDVTYDLQLVVRENSLYLQVMWAYLEQQSFPMDEESYIEHLNEVLEVINRLGLAGQVRKWLYSLSKRPNVGRALSFPLKADDRLREFLL